MRDGANMITETLSNAEYHAHLAISKSGLDLMSRSPAHYRFRAPRKPSRAMELGTAIHTAILEPDRFAAEYMLLSGVDDRRSSVYKEATKQYGTERVLTGAEADQVAGMQESVAGNRHAQNMLRHADARTELSIITTDPVTGVPVKCRFDLLVGNRALDLKSTADARPDAFCKSIANYRYHVQAAFYTDVFHWETGDNLAAFGFFAVESDMPHANAIYVLDDDSLEFGRKLYRRDLDLYAECLNSGNWPALSLDPQILSLPAWAMKETV
jgi:exodeoxyribonuclease VIII